MIIKVLDKVDSYLDAIKISCDLLEKEGIVENRYYDAIVDKIKEYGPYFCIADRLCMPHARPEDGAIKEGVCVLKLNNPIDFMGKDVHVFFTLSAKDNKSHLDIMKKLSEVFVNKEKLDKIINSQNEEEIKEVL